MRKIFTLFILLLLLPVTAVADNPTTFTVGGTNAHNGGYWLTNADGTLTSDGASADNDNVYYDGNGTLNLGGHTLIAKNSDGTRTVTKEITVSKATSSISINNTYNPGKIYDGTALAVPTESELTLTGAGYNDVTFTWYKGSVADANKLGSAPKDAGTYYLVVSIADSDNTSGSSTTSGEIAISPAPLYVIANANSKIYGEADPTLTYQCIDLVGLDILTGELSRTKGENVGDYAITRGSLSAGSNYTLFFTGAILTITAKPVTLTWSTPTTFTYDGNEHSVTAEVTNAVDEGTFALTYDENSKTAVGNYTAKVTGLGNSNYTLDGATGTEQVWSIVGVSIADAEVTLDKNSFTYTGSGQKPEVTAVTLDEKALTKDTDYTVAYSDKSINAGEYTVTVTGKGNYSGTATATYTISPAALTITGATLASKTYDGTTNATVESVTFDDLKGSDILTIGTDYTAEAKFTDKSAAESKTATVTVTLTNTVKNYTLASGGNTATATGTISPLPVVLKWSTQTEFTYDGTEHFVTAQVTNLVVGDEITLTYEDYTGTAVSSYTAKVIWLSGIDANNYTLDGATGTEQVWSIVGVPIADAKVTLDKNSFTYTGSEQKPEVTAVTLGGKALTANTDYTVTFGDNSTDADTYTVTVTGTGNYSGTATATYTITPAALTITGATLASKTYDGTTNATVESVTFNGLVNSESLTLNTDYTATAVFADANAGTDKSATVTVTLSNGNYSLATSTYTLENQTIVQAVFDGTTEISGSVLANCSDEVKLPDIPDGASYGTPTSNDVTDMSITDGVLHYTGGSGVTSEETYTITVPVTGATNYLDYNITVTLTGKKIVTVEAVGSENPSFSTSQDRFTLTATVSGEKLSENPDCWTWDIADKTVADFIDSPTTRSMSVSDSRTFEIKGPGTTTITATYDDGKYHGSVIFSVSISKPTTPDPQPAIYNIYVEDVCDGVEVSTSKQAVKEGGSIIVYVEKDTAHYTFDNFHVYYKEGYYGPWVELPEGVQPGEYPIKNIWNHIYIKAEGAEEKEDPTGIEQIEGVKVYTKDGSLYVQTPQREQVIIVSMSGAVVKNEEQIGLKQYHGLQPGIYIVRVGDRAYKLRLH